LADALSADEWRLQSEYGNLSAWLAPSFDFVDDLGDPWTGSLKKVSH
jgi:hypothetical protein